MLKCCDVFSTLLARYRSRTLSYLGANLTEQCNDHCHCEREIWDPICGQDNIMYFSPCYAGCQVTIEGEKKVTFAKASIAYLYMCLIINAMLNLEIENFGL